MTEALEKEKLYTLAEYFALSERSEEKLEYHNGKIVARREGTIRRIELVTRTASVILLSIDEEDKRFRVYGSDVRIQISNYNQFAYPDASVVIQQPEHYRNRQDTIVNPLLVMEVLSPSTEKHDRTSKFIAYRTIPSLREYVLVDQDQPRVTTFFRNDAQHWEDADAIGLEEDVRLQSIDCEIPLSRIYKNINFD
ncbi:MAG: Uma2 family endonuclease [Bacteroidota bacterium]